MKVIIIRHGQTDDNINNIVQGSGGNSPINEIGKKQTFEAAKKLKEFNLSIIYCSKMLRAYQTAEIIAAQTKCLLKPIDGLEEVHFGEAEGMIVDEAHKKYADIFEIINNKDNPKCFDVSIPKGETVRQSLLRGIGTLQKIINNENNSVIGIVTHGGIMFNLYEHFFDKQRVFANCEFFEIELDAKKIEDEYKKAVLK